MVGLGVKKSAMFCVSLTSSLRMQVNGNGRWKQCVCGIHRWLWEGAERSLSEVMEFLSKLDKMSSDDFLDKLLQYDEVEYAIIEGEVIRKCKDKDSKMTDKFVMKDTNHYY